jgi:exodeoxyribonuclease-5
MSPTTIEIEGVTITLSCDQHFALAACLEELKRSRHAILSGAAGTGKTTVMKALLSAWPGPVMFLAPTGKAAVRLSESTGRGAKTIHSSIFGTVDEEQEGEEEGGKETLRFGELHPPEGCTSSTLVVVDEASMVNTKLANELRTAVGQVGGNILWVGDHEQLPPVEGGWGVDLANATGKLTQVHRQALDSAVLKFATMIRKGEMGLFDTWGGDVTKQKVTVAKAAEWRERDDNRVLLTWTNRIRKQANALIRKSRGHKIGVPEIGETLICTFNNHDLAIMNGETFEIAAIEPHPTLSILCEQPILWVKPVGRPDFVMAPRTFDASKKYPGSRRAMTDRAIYREVWSNLFLQGNPADDESPMGEFLAEKGISASDFRRARSEAMDSGVQGTWGYCLTVHKSQGSQWKEVGFMSCPGFRRKGSYLTLEDKRRMLYTAVTRAESRLHIFTLTA